MIPEFQEDLWIAESFRNDGHTVDFSGMEFDESLDSKYDIFLKRNYWDTDSANFEVGKTSYSSIYRIKTKNMPRINFDGKFDGSGTKHYLAELYDNGMPVIPTVVNCKDLCKLPASKTYLLKPHNGYDGFGILECGRDEVAMKWNENFVIQPKLCFTSEVQFYYVGNDFHNALEYSPSKLSDHTKVKPYQFSPHEFEIAQSFADLSPNHMGVQRIDFIKTENGLLLLEIEDASPYLNLVDVDATKRQKFIDAYKAMVYSHNTLSK